MKRLLSIMVLLVTLFSIQSGIAESAGNTLQAMYQEAELLMVQGNYTEAASKFEAMGAYSDSSQMATYCKAVACAEMEMYDIAIVALEGLGEFKDCPQLAKYYTARYYEDMVRGGCILLALGEADADLRVYNELLKQTRDLYAELVLYKDSMTRYKDTERLYEDLKAANTARINAEKEKIYQQALSLEQQGQYLEAVDVYNQIPEYKDSKTKAEFCWETHHITIYQEAEDLIKDGKFEQAIEAFLMIADYKDATARVQMLHYVLAEKALDEERYEEASSRFVAAGTYSDAASRINEPYYRQAEALQSAGDEDGAVAAFKRAVPYSDAENRWKEILYQQALQYINEQKWLQSYETLRLLDDYKDCRSKVNEIQTSHLDALQSTYPALRLVHAKLGDYISFGMYDQDTATPGREEIEWLVLAKENNRLLVISRYVIENMSYKENRTSDSWENCSLRRWLNGKFLKVAFSDAERTSIPTVTVSADTTGSQSTHTSDQVFLLSSNEVKKYFPKENSRKCLSTAYANKQALFLNKRGPQDAEWWLRTPSNNSISVTIVDKNGKFQSSGVTDFTGGVRPALWISLEP